MAGPAKKHFLTLFSLIFLPFYLCGAEGNTPGKVLIMGDSHAHSLKDEAIFHRAGARWQADILGISSSGLARRDFYDWLNFARSPESGGYDLYVVILGTNDGQNSHGTDDEVFGTLEWEYLYTARVESLITELKARGEVIWVSIPPVRDESLRRKTEYLQALIDEVCLYHGVRQIDLGDLITGDMQNDDGIHLSSGGVKLVSAALSRELDDLF